MNDWLKRNQLPIGAFVVALIVFLAVAGPRLRKASPDPHFAAQAAAWLKGRMDIDPWPAGADDPAQVDEVRLASGEIVRGRRVQSRNVFLILGGRTVPLPQVAATLRTLRYVSFPPVPSLIMLPQAALHGARANDVATTCVLAALVPALLLLVLRRLREAKLSERTPVDEAWLAALLAFGTVFFFSAVQGRVWFTAHVVGVLFAVLYAWASIEAKSPIVAGLCFGLAVGTRTPMILMAPLFLLEAWRMGRAGLVRRVLLFAAPAAAIGVALAAYNYARFHSITEFGHSYLWVRQQAQIERYGLFSLHYLGRNLAVALTLLPDLSLRKPFVSISGHGLAIWFTSPLLLALLWPRVKNRLHTALWATVAGVAAFSLLYQNSGWLQFGYRFSLDYMVFLVLLLAVGGRPFGKISKGLIVLGVVINLFGAISFARMNQHYRGDAKTYDCVVQH
jgi:hypothetical protein